MEISSSQKEKEIKSIWISKQRLINSEEDQSERNSELPDNNSDLFDLDIADCCYFNDDLRSVSKQLVKYQETKRETLQKLKIFKLDPVSIPSTAGTSGLPVVNIKQCFTFPAPLKPSSEISTQTSQVDLLKNELLVANSVCSIKRPLSLPQEIVPKVNISKRVQADVEPTMLANMIGDGDKNIQIKDSRAMNERNYRAQPDLELAEYLPASHVQCVLIKPKSSRINTSKLSYKKRHRPQTKFVKMRPTTIDDDQLSAISSACNQDTLSMTKPQNETLCKKPENLLNIDTPSGLSSDAGVDTLTGSFQAKLCHVVDKLQDHEWEVCIEGLKAFLLFARSMNWESELGLKFIPIISRKLIDFFKSPRSNLCRTACQTAGEFFIVAKSTKRPEFDEMIDILLNKTADPNRFIQKDAVVALDKMAMSICVHHSVRAVCAKAPDHKNSIVRASTARLLYHICSNAGDEQIIGSNANPRTRKRVLTSLAKFLMDKNQETRRHAEKLCKMLKCHKFFIEYFFKDVENNFKTSLRKIINSLDKK